MKKAAYVLIALALTAPIVGQTPDLPQPSYRFINTWRMGRIDERITEWGKEGYDVQFVGRCPSSDVAVLLKRDDERTRTYRFVTTSRYATFIKEVNEAGLQGFRLVRGAAAASFPKSVQWIAVLAHDPSGQKFTYSGLQVNDEGMKLLVEAVKRGAIVAAGLGDRFILEESQGGKAPSASSSETDYRLVSTQKTSTLEAELQRAATEGFHTVESAMMRVLVARDQSSSPSGVDYHLIAMRRAPTAERELQAAGGEGFRLNLTMPCTEQEGMFILHRPKGSTERYDYRVVALKEETADVTLQAAGRDGYRVSGLLNEFAVLERQLRN